MVQTIVITIFRVSDIAVLLQEVPFSLLMVSNS
jgi:hypothetical protein